MKNRLTSEEVQPASSAVRRFLGFGWLASLGPGFVYVLTALGTGDIVSNSAAGASYGYHLIWALGMTLIFRFVWVNLSAKYVLVTGESLLTGYRRVGRWVPWLFLIALLPIRCFYMSYAILMFGRSAHLLFPLPTESSTVIWACFFTFLGFALPFWGGYAVVEWFCKLLIGMMGASLVVAASLSHPDPAAILEGTFIPSLPQAEGLYSAILIVLALIGTEVGSTANLNYSYFIREKGWTGISHLKQQRFDLTVGVIALFVMGALLQIAAAGTIYPLGIQVEDADDLGRIFSETQGFIGLIVFALGLWGSAFSSFVGGNTGGALIFTDICRSVVPGLKQSKEERQKRASKEDPIYRRVIIFWSFAPLYIIFTGVSPVWFVLMVNAFVVVLIPVLVAVLLIITNDERLMGEYKNGWLTNMVMLLLVVVTVYLTWNRLAN